MNPNLVYKMTPIPKKPRDLKYVRDLNERIKELKCLYDIFKLFAMMDVPLDKTLQEVVDLIPNGWQFSEIACARLVIGDKEYRSEQFVQSDWILTATIAVNREKVGVLEIAYAQRRPDCFNGPFLEEEIFLLEAVSSLIGQTLQRKALEEEKTRLYRDLQKNYEKIISGFIPICASCKNIRDEKGIWHQLETYVQKRTDAKFSHSICPVCAKKLYPFLEDR